MQEKRNQIIEDYLHYVKTHAKIPTLPRLFEYGHSKSAISHNFGSLAQLHHFIEENYTDRLSECILLDKDVFSPTAKARLKESVAKYQRFIITTAVVNKEVHKGFLAAIKNYEYRNEAKLLILPCADVMGTRKQVKWGFDPVLNGEEFVTEETWLNHNLFISDILTSAKMIRPIVGLDRVGQRNGSLILASPKQDLNYTATSPAKERMPKAIMSTGAITVPNYDNDYYMSQRTSYLAENDHVMGAVIVEIVDDRRFHFRQVQANANGEFVDLAVRYFPDNEIAVERADFYAGDWHSGATDMIVAATALRMCEELGVVDFYTGDFFDGYSISHHHDIYPLRKAMKSEEGRSNLRDELEFGIVDMNDILSCIQGNLYLIPGNHDEVLERYLKEGRYVSDPENHRASLKYAEAWLDGRNPLEFAYKDIGGTDFTRIVFLSRDEECRIGHVEVGQHGDKGANGSSASLAALEKAYGACIVGHAHSPAIFRSVYRVGTFTKLQLEYNVGPSSWVHCGCLIYEDGSRQLVNFIEGEYRL